jgi:hypothetical protein
MDPGSGMATRVGVGPTVVAQPAATTLLSRADRARLRRGARGSFRPAHRGHGRDAAVPAHRISEDIASSVPGRRSGSGSVKAASRSTNSSAPSPAGSSTAARVAPML